MRFIKKGTLKLGPRAVLRDLTIIAGLVFINFTWTFFSIGIALFLIGAALHLWSKACLVRNQVVTIIGPYRLVRHPFYLANMLIDIGICFFSGNLYILAVYMPISALTYMLTINKEEKYLKGRHGELYVNYQKDVPALIPYKLHHLFGNLDASWENIRKEHEIPRLLRILSMPLFFIILNTLYEYGNVTDALKKPTFIFIIIAAISLNIASQLIMYKLKHLKRIEKATV